MGHRTTAHDTTPPTGLTIGRLARSAGVHIETIRYYQRRGLLPLPPKPPGNMRRYPPATLARLRFIKRAQELGFTLREIGDLLRLSAGECGQTRSLAERKRDDIAVHIKDLRAHAARAGEIDTHLRHRAPGAVPDYSSASETDIEPEIPASNFAMTWRPRRSAAVS